jgi:hypothetical protein
MPQTENTTDAVVEKMEQWRIANQSLIQYAHDLYIQIIDLIEVVEAMPESSDPTTDLYIAVNVARVTLDRIREGVQS